MSTADNGNILTFEFNSCLRLFKQYQTTLRNEDRFRASKWANKLKDSNSNIPEMKLRNKLIAALLIQMQTGTLAAPFDNDPTFTRLESVEPMPAVTNGKVFPEHFKLPQIMRQSPDQGVFLMSQPVPKSGTFCYLAVSSRPPKK